MSPRAGHRLARHPLVHASPKTKESNFWCFAGQEPKTAWLEYARGRSAAVSAAVKDHWNRVARGDPIPAATGDAAAASGLAFRDRVRAAPRIFGVDATPANTYCRTGGAGRQVAPKFARAALGAGARVVAMVRDAADRAYSDYRYFASFQRARGTLTLKRH